MKYCWPSAVIVLLAAHAAVAGEPLDFNRDVRPILTNHCFTCHGPDAKSREADLRLDDRDVAVEFEAIVPGQPDDSELIRRITTPDADEVMPPRETGKQLEAREIALLTRWISEGAAYAPHWAYVQPVRREPPQVNNGSWPQNPIDHFVLRRLEAAGLQPSQAADRYTLIRRLSLDLTGLPPTIDEVDAFVNDNSADAYGQLVDRLLEKDAYGEHWARMWLDLARYADSAGYADDPPRTIWSFRDYVIRSLNANQRFDQFTIEQIAGDLLPEATQEQLIATAFHRNTLTNNEGGTNDEEFRNVAIVDRVNTTMAVWMGTTINCAQCHDHKYDPISQEEFFRLFALFNNTEDADRKNESPTIEVSTVEDRQNQQRLLGEQSHLQQQLGEFDLNAGLARWEKQTQTRGQPELPLARFVRVTNRGNGVFLHVAEVQVLSGGENVALQGKASQVSTDFGGPPERAIDGNTNGDYQGAKSTTHTASGNDPWWEVDLQQDLPIQQVVVWNRTDGGGAIVDRLKDWRIEALDANRQVVWKQDIQAAPSPNYAADPAGQGLPAPIVAVLNKPRDQRSDEERQLLWDHYRGIAGELKPLREQLAKIDQQLKQIKTTKTTVPVMRELAAGKRRKTHIQVRGNFLALGKEVSEGVLSALHPLAEGAPMNRLTLARWLVDENNPLTARVIVNRYWEAIFGIGLVRTSEEFGAQGELPSHPELLDWLATELVDEDWDLQHLLKRLVTSAAYRQSSRVTTDLRQRDPDNRLLARGPRFRLSAEMIRDQALFAGGLLSPKMYGPPVRPPQPTLGVKAAFGGGIDWQTSVGADRHRRGLYTTWRRSNPYPSMATFDAPTREVCTLHRARTNTPLQALVTLNDPVYVEAAQALARRMAAADGQLADQVKLGFRLCLARHPRDDELIRLGQLFQQSYERFTQDSQKAQQLATKPIGALPVGADVAELAALTVVANVLLNLDEMLMKR